MSNVENETKLFFSALFPLRHVFAYPLLGAHRVENEINTLVWTFDEHSSTAKNELDAPIQQKQRDVFKEWDKR